ncbi:helix-turn-helix domain-containing protein [Algoriphagus marincola]|uniref:helix-turn-helix domain-containing protein n=1 Tax=Algoriphagus marincola TaxID=264027 RepID=UPI00042061FF|nr:helix-turn-helix transcriptional regulator [Algoriphagus marincola]
MVLRALLIGKNPILESNLIQVLDEISSKFILDKIILDEALPSYEYFEKFDFIFFDDHSCKREWLKFHRKLKPVFLENNVSFFLVLGKTCGKEEIYIALEAGVENILFLPLDLSSAINKLKNSQDKKKFFSFYNSKDYKLFFDNSSNPKMFVKRGVVERANHAFFKSASLLNEKSIIGKEFFKLFDFESDESNSLNMQRFEHQLVKSVEFLNVRLRQNNELFHIRTISVSNRSSRFIAEIHPVSKPQKESFKDLYLLTNENYQEHNNNGFSNDYEKLTKRERQVLDLSSKGLPLKEIAQNLGLSKRTVERHRANIMQKADAHNILEAILFFSDSEVRV